jgi:hypothetical protein
VQSGKKAALKEIKKKFETRFVKVVGLCRADLCRYLSGESKWFFQKLQF